MRRKKLMRGGRKVPFYPATALTIAGAKVETKGFFQPHVVQDRELISRPEPSLPIMPSRSCS